MIQLLKLPPLVPGSVTDSTGVITFLEPASTVEATHGTLSTQGLVIPTGGTLSEKLTPVDPYAVFDWSQYAERDAQLIGRDHVVASAIVRVSSAAATVFGARCERPTQTTLAPVDLPSNSQDRSAVVSPEGTIQLVQPSSVPYDEVRADVDLYGRDLLLHETLARVSGIFVSPPVSSVGGVSTVSDVWTVGDAGHQDVGINPALRLDCNLFSNPDKTLIFQDNSLGVYVANIEGFLENPFVSAKQLVVQVSNNSSPELEAEVYVHDPSQDTATIRVWTAEPKLDGRFKLVYYIDTGLLRWYPPDSSLIHVPQPQPFVGGTASIPGIQTTETIDFVVDSLQRQDAAYYAQKAAQITTKDRQFKTVSLLSGAYSAGIDQGNLVQNVQITQSNSVLLQSLANLGTNDYVVGLTVVPQSFFEIFGCQFPQLASTTDSGGLFPAAGPTTAAYEFSILAGNYQLELSYTNYGGDTPDDFPVLVSYGGSVITSSPLPFGSESKTDGEVVTRAYNMVSDGTSGLLSITWTGPATSSQLKITKVRIVSSDTTPLAVKLSATLYDGSSAIGTSTFEFNGLRNRPDVALFTFTNSLSVTAPTLVVSLVGNTNLTALAINQVQLAISETLVKSPNISGLDGYPSAMLDRAYDSVLDSFHAIANYEDPRVQVDSTHTWTLESTTSWLAQLQSTEPRLLDAFDSAGPVDIGLPALVPLGLEYVASASHPSSLPVGSVLARSSDTRPVLAALTAWMLTQRFLVAKSAFIS